MDMDLIYIIGFFVSLILFSACHKVQYFYEMIVVIICALLWPISTCLMIGEMIRRQIFE